MNLLNIKDNLPFIGGIVGLFTLITASYKGYKSRLQRNREWLNGKWTNEGDMSADISKPSHYMDLELEVDKEDGHIAGILKCRDLQTDETIVWDIHGKSKLTHADLNFIQVISAGRSLTGRPTVLSQGKARVWFVDKRNVNFELEKGDRSLIPGFLILTRY